jgi:hypothetical protein
MLTNNVHSIYDDWPKNTEVFKNYITEKYGSIAAALATAKYYYDSYGNIIDFVEYTNLSINNRSAETAYEWELKLNTNKSKIKIIGRDTVIKLESGLNSVLSKPIV